MVPAICQGIIGIQIRACDRVGGEKNADLGLLCKSASHHPTMVVAGMERLFLHVINATCKTPIGAHANILEDNSVHYTLMIADNSWANVYKAHFIVDSNGIVNMIQL
jgi:porphobilinogen deaminase